MDDKDRELLGHLRKGLALTSKPFESLAGKINLDAADVLLRVLRLKEEGRIGAITAVLDAKQFLYQSIWIAAEFEEDGPMAEAAEAGIHQHPGVVRSHGRFHKFNFWFTLMLPCTENFEDHLRMLRQIPGVRNMVALPALRTFSAGSEVEAPSRRPAADFDPAELKVLRALQEDVLAVDFPFSRMAAASGMKEKLFLETAQNLVKRGVVKRVAALFPAEQKTPPPQSMVVWRVPEEKQASAAVQMSLVPGVTHCVQRRACPDFPYSLYMFFTSASGEEEKVILETESKVGKWPWLSIPVVREGKTVRPQYFPNLESWNLGCPSVVSA